MVGIVTTKIKGAYEFDSDRKFMDGCDNYFKSDFLVFDPADYVVSPQVHAYTMYTRYTSTIWMANATSVS